MRLSRALSWCAGLLLLVGCSGLVSPDESRLDPGSGARDGGLDTGPRPDSGSGPRDSGPGRTDGEPPPPPPEDGGPPPPEDGGGPPGDGGPIDTGPRPCSMPCDDGISCTLDECRDGTCVSTADSTLCSGDQVCSPLEGCVARHCVSDAECQDGDFCNGAETCLASAPGSGCVRGAAPTCDDGLGCTSDSCSGGGCVHEADDGSCDDGVDCTLDFCRPGPGAAADGCIFQPDDTRCDGNFCDGVTCVAAAGCRSTSMPSCDDADSCTVDSCDRDAERCAHDPRDDDRDGHVRQTADGHSCGGDDCDDTNPTIFRGATEICGNGVDESCDGVDEPCTVLPGETCTTAIPIVLEGGRATMTGNTTRYRHDHRSSCSAAMSTAPDVVYVLRIRGHHDVVVDTVGSGFDTVVAAANGCGTGMTPSPSYRACDDDIRRSSDTDSRIWLRNIGNDVFEESWYLFVDGYASDNAGDYVLDVAVLAPSTSGSCGASGTTPSSFDVSAGGTLYGEVPTRFGASAGSCGGGGTPNPPEDVVSLRSEAGGGVELRLSRVDSVALGSMTLYARGGPACSTATEVGCQTTTMRTLELSYSADAAMTYWMMVDTGPGRYTLDVDPP